VTDVSGARTSWLIAACALVVYVAFASSYVVDADGAELATLGAIGGRAHPSGYPLYVLWLRAWSWLPGTPAHGAAIATAILGAAAIGVLHAACRAWGARPLAATISVAILGAAPLIVHFHSQAEVFALNHLIVALVLWLAAGEGPLRGSWRGAALGLVAGLGLANHLTCVLVAPIGLLGVVRAARESRAHTVGLAMLGLVVGLVPYAYLVVADGPASWGTVTRASDLLAIFLRAEYGTTGLVPGASLPWTTCAAACIASIARSWLWIFAVAGGVMLGVRIWRPRGESRWAWALLAGCFVLAGPVLATRFNIEPRGIGLYIVQRFHLLPTVLLAIPVAAALELVCARITRTGVATALAIVGFAALSIAALPRLARAHSPAMELGVRNLLGSLPPGAIVVVISEDQCFTGHYLQLARGVRPDISFVCSELLRRDWYRVAWARRGLRMPAAPASGPDASLGRALLATHRPVFVDRGLGGVLAAYPSYPVSVVYRLLPAGTSPPSPSDIARLNRDLFAAFDLDYPHPGRDDDFAAVAHRRYTAAWAAISDRLAAAGDPGGAAEAYDVARSLQPLQDE
jgi:hypothetical protein